MIIRNMRWAIEEVYGCDPLDSSFMVETLVSDDNEHNYFILCSRFAERYRLEISETPLLDILKYAPGTTAACDYEMKKIETAAFETYNFEKINMYEYDCDPEEEPVNGFDVFECPEMFQSRFADAIKVTLLAMEECSAMSEPTDLEASMFVEEYLDQDLADMEIQM